MGRGGGAGERGGGGIQGLRGQPGGGGEGLRGQPGANRELAACE